MNEDTRVSVHCYAGDGPDVIDALEMYLHHECPLTILSPVNSRVTVPGQDCKYGGQRQSAGQLSLDRQRRHMEMLLHSSERFFFMNDADSMCLSPKLPDYLYAEPNVLWSNLVYNPLTSEREGYSTKYYPHGFPRLAFQPPYFISREIMERLLAVAPSITVNPIMPYIDHYMVQLAVKARVTFKAFPDGLSYAISTGPGEMERALVEVRHKGFKIIHSVKGKRYWRPLLEAHRKYVADFNRIATTEIDTTATYHPVPLLTATWSADKQFLSYLPNKPRPAVTAPPAIRRPILTRPMTRSPQLIGSKFRRGLKA